ncbi:hypothetical protein [Nisaea nitritireducens]|uniref:hypothetical protein n=1 Tax=Nisaea nitritireducens TaxID=568392 RepID=UPI0018690374|nr:hypothetical protein [Nisaea nitritireducens]
MLSRAQRDSAKVKIVLKGALDVAAASVLSEQLMSIVRTTQGDEADISPTS